MKTTGPLTILTLAILAAPCITMADTFIKEESREFNANSITRVVIDGYAADVDVAGWDENRITVDIVMSVDASDEEKANQIFDQTDLRFVEEEGTLKVILKAKNNNSGWSLFGLFKKTAGARISVNLPHRMDLGVDTGSGNIKVNALNGTLKLDSGSGNVTGNQLAGEIRADTGSGNVQLTDVDGNIKGDTGSGNIKISNMAGELSADTGSGDVKADGAISRFDADTGSGNVSVTSSVVLEGTSRAATGSGDVRVELPADAAFKLAAGTGSGDVKCSFTVSDPQATKNSLSGTVNGGQAKLVIATGSGNINIIAAN